MKLEFVDRNDFKKCHRDLFAQMLEKQGKVRPSFADKIDRCKTICIASIDGEPAAIGAIKKKTESDFSKDKSGLIQLKDKFNYELGYFFTAPDYVERKLARSIAQLLISHFGDENLMASTEISANPAMVKILENNGFRLYGSPWKSSIHKSYLGLFLKVE